MRKLILAWTLAALMAVSCTAVHVSTKAPPTPFEQVCAELQVDCSDIPEPIVVYSEILDYVGFGGVYGAYIHGEPYVLVSPNSPNIVKTVIHEIVHYVSVKSGIYKSRCSNEGLARVVSSKLTNTEVDETWPERYGCTRNKQ